MCIAGVKAAIVEKHYERAVAFIGTLTRSFQKILKNFIRKTF